MISIPREEKMLMLQTEVEANYKLHNSWADSVCAYCNKYDIEEVDVVKYLSPFLIDVLKKEALKNKTVRLTENTLPF